MVMFLISLSETSSGSGFMIHQKMASFLTIYENWCEFALWTLFPNEITRSSSLNDQTRMLNVLLEIIPI